MKIKQERDSILIYISKRTPLTLDTVEVIYDITGSYDEILTLNDIAIKYNRDIIELAHYLYK